MGALRASLVAVALVPALALAAAPSPTQADVEEARALFKRGQAYYNIDEFRQAADLFKQAYVRHPDPTFLYNIAQCHRKMGEVDEALSYFRKYLKSSPNAPNRPEVERRIKELEEAQVAEMKAREAPPTGIVPPGSSAGSGAGRGSGVDALAAGHGRAASRGAIAADRRAAGGRHRAAAP
jgi:tetratricopeptide (TPR) repeat protein